MDPLTLIIAGLVGTTLVDKGIDLVRGGTPEELIAKLQLEGERSQSYETQKALTKLRKKDEAKEERDRILALEASGMRAEMATDQSQYEDDLAAINSPAGGLVSGAIPAVEVGGLFSGLGV